MISRPRIIPTLLLDEGKLVKTQKFKKPHYLGDPLNAIKIFNEKGVDELCILDISATKANRAPDFDILKRMAEEAFMPLSYGGGITTIEQARQLFYIGFEKVVINTSLIENPRLVKEIIDIYGSQSVIASIDYRKKWGKQRCYIRGGRKQTKYSLKELCEYAENQGVGEILLYSIERDGMSVGYDINVISEIAEKLHIPLIACGGASKLEDIKAVLEEGKATAVAAGSLFVYYGKKKAVLINYPDESILLKYGIYKEET